MAVPHDAAGRHETKLLGSSPFSTVAGEPALELDLAPELRQVSLSFEPLAAAFRGGFKDFRAARKLCAIESPEGAAGGMDESVYEQDVVAALPRVLAWYDTDPLSPSFGLGDRHYWAWKLIDYPNATPQGAVHGLAALIAAGRLPAGISRDAVMRRIDAAILACRRIVARDGSLGEAFPNEKSFCVTALIAFDILCTLDLIGSQVGEARRLEWRRVVEPMIAFLISNDETHAIISNHLATAAAALFRWSDSEHAPALARARELLGRILAHQSAEGWFSEYGGFDPGYETLGLCYLADIHKRRPQEGLKRPLERSLNMLVHAAHPDGSFGGLYGSRNTRFVVPAGLELLASEFPAAAALARFARRAVHERTVPTLATMDDPNFAPMFNSYCRALLAAAPLPDTAPLPCQDPSVWRRSFLDAGLVVDRGSDHYTIVSTKKGGVVAHFTQDGAVLDSGAAATEDGKLYSSQAFLHTNDVESDDEKLVVTAPFVRVVTERLTPLKMILLRILCLTVFRFRPLGELVKQRLVARLIATGKAARVANRRTIRFGRRISIIDEFAGPTRLERIASPGAFRAIHMASSGYWQAGDDRS